MTATSVRMRPSPGPSATPPSDEELVERARSGDPEAFRELVRCFTPRVYAMARNLVNNPGDAEDVTQEVFFKVHAKLHGFREDAAFSTWLYRVTLNAAADYRKRRRHEKVVSIDEAAWLPLVAPGDGPGDGLGRADLRAEVRRAMARLPEKFRSILVLRELEELSYQDIGDILGLNKGTVESRLFRARARLRQELERTLRPGEDHP